jgi:DNA mismatch endonuclease (patch repair protein)
MKKYDTAIFINGCYWHGHGDCYYSHEASTNKEYWKPKIENNKIRDEKHQKELEELGFKVYIIWECEIRKRLNETLEILIGKIQSH